MNQTHLFRDLRALVPKRRLSYSEVRRIVELQANVMRQRLNPNDDELPAEVLERLPRLDVRYVHDLPVSGLTHWHNGRWVTLLSADEPPARRHFSLAHEIFHALSHTTQEYLCDGGASAERLADYFAGCLLAPKRLVTSRWFEHRKLEVIADSFGISLPAAKVRLSQLGLIDPIPRCARPDASWNHFKPPYFRNKSLPGGVAG